MDEYFGAPPSASRGGCDARSAPLTLTVQMRKFVQEVAVSDADMLTINVTLRKEDYGMPDSSDYRKNMA